MPSSLRSVLQKLCLKMSDTTGNMFNSCALPISSVEGLEDETSSLNVFFCSDDRSSPSKNTISERRRRRRLNESLYSLRAIVPIITKMDKASIIEDAINYIHQLQKQVKVAEEDVVRLKENITSPCERECSHVESKGESMEELWEFDISEVKENVFSICLYCKGSPRLFVELDRVLESMEMLVTFANFNSFDGSILINIIVQKEDGEKLQVNVLKRVIAEVIK